MIFTSKVIRSNMDIAAQYTPGAVAHTGLSGVDKSEDENPQMPTHLYALARVKFGKH